MNEKIKQLFLANFCDGDKWEDTKGISFSNHGALDIAEFFYEQGVEEERKRAIEIIEIAEFASKYGTISFKALKEKLTPPTEARIN